MRALLILLLTIAMAVPTLAQNRHALVIGIDAYENVPSLQKANNDARAMFDALTLLGFETELVVDADEDGLDRALDGFVGRIQPGDQALFFFAGHGTEIRGRNYLVPSDAPAPGEVSERSFTGDALGVHEVLDAIQERGPRTTLMILDACRDNPFARVPSGRRSIGGARGLAEMRAPQGTFIVYSAGAGQTALDRLSDDDPDPNSVFTRTLLQNMTVPGLGLRSMMGRVRSQVRALSLRADEPQDQFLALYDQLDGDFFFAEPESDDNANGVQSVLLSEPALQQNADVQADPCAVALPFWMAIQGQGSEAALESFLAGYPACTVLTALAQDRLAALRSQSDPNASQQLARPGETSVPLDPCMAAAAVWPAIQESQSETAFQSFFADFGDCTTFAALAQGRLAALRAMGAEVPVERRGPGEPASTAVAPDAGSPVQIEVAEVPVRDSYIECTGIMEPEGGAERDLTGADLSRAIDACRVAMDEDPGSAHVVALLSRALRLDHQDVEAARLARIAAEAGDPLGMANLAFHFLTGRGLSQDAAEALRLNRQAAEAGSASAMYNLALMLERGNGVARNAPQAAQWYLQSLRNGRSYLLDRAAGRPGDVMREIQRLLMRDGFYSGSIDGAYGQQTRIALERLAAAGPSMPSSTSAALTSPLSLYEQCNAAANQEQVPFEQLQRANLPEVIRLCSAAVESNSQNGPAVFLLGRAYSAAGRHVEAVMQYRIAIGLGEANAMSNLGLSYQNGDGVARDYAEAARWYRAGVELGNAAAMNNLGTLHAGGLIGPQDHAEAMRLYRAAAELGNSYAMYNVARLFERGLGVRRDDAEAARWFLSSLRAGRVAVLTRAGERPSSVMLEIQRILSDDGYYNGALDGSFGAQTRAAMQRFANG